jgi:hypothetical protein
MLGGGFQKATDVAAAGEMLAGGAQHDDPHLRLLVDGFEHESQLVALQHFDDVERLPVEDDIGALVLAIDLDPESVKARMSRIGKSHRSAHTVVPCWSLPAAPRAG